LAAQLKKGQRVAEDSLREISEDIQYELSGTGRVGAD
jgi:hypothetical protein